MVSLTVRLRNFGTKQLTKSVPLVWKIISFLFTRWLILVQPSLNLQHHISTQLTSGKMNLSSLIKNLLSFLVQVLSVSDKGLSLTMQRFTLLKLSKLQVTKLSLWTLTLKQFQQTSQFQINCTLSHWPLKTWWTSSNWNNLRVLWCSLVVKQLSTWLSHCLKQVWKSWVLRLLIWTVPKTVTSLNKLLLTSTSHNHQVKQRQMKKKRLKQLVRLASQSLFVRHTFWVDVPWKSWKMKTTFALTCVQPLRRVLTTQSLSIVISLDVSVK